MVQLQTRYEAKSLFEQILIASIAMYGSDIWTLKADDEWRLLTFKINCMRSLLGVICRG